MTDVQTGLMRINPGEQGDHVFALGNTSVTVSGVADKGFYRLAAAQPKYLVIDLSGGPGAGSYPWETLSEAPAGGWTDEHKTTKLVLRHIPAGKFLMGSHTNELGRSDTEDLHEVTLTQRFYIGSFPVTQRQWELVMGTLPSHFNNAQYYATRPVEHVSYEMIRGSTQGAQWPSNNNVDASSFLGVLRAKTSLTADLPTEAQWEYACRAGTTHAALNSDKNLTDTTQCPNVTEVGRKGVGHQSYQSCATNYGTAAVGSYRSHKWGLYDMHGNVWEWCLDWHASRLGTSAVTDPKGNARDTDYGRVVRGGSYKSNASDCRSAQRSISRPDYNAPSIGFRVYVLHL